jgi:hypothetical protein
VNEHGQVYFELEALIPEEDRQRLLEAEERASSDLKRLVSNETMERLRRVEDKAFLYGS